MTPIVTGPDLRSLPRFTFAGRGCRDPRREPRRLPQSLRIQAPGQPTGTTAPVATDLPAAGNLPARRSTTSGPTGPDDDRPPPAALRYGPAPWQIPMSPWWSSGAAMPS